MNATSADQITHRQATAEGPFDWQDPLHISQQLTDEERLFSDSAREFCQRQLMPRVKDIHRHENFDRNIMN